MNLRIFILFPALYIAGCATSPIPAKQAQLIPSERVFRTESLPLEGNAKAIFIRDVGFSGSGVFQHLYIDGVKAASLNPGERVEFFLAPGDHIFGVVPTDPFGVHALNSIDQDLKAGKKYFYRLQTDGNSFRTVIERIVTPVE